MNFRLDNDFLAILANVDLRYLADLDGFVANLGFIRFEVIGAVESDFDARSLRKLLSNGDEDGGQHHQCGQNPDQGQPHATRRVGHGAR